MTKDYADCLNDLLNDKSDLIMGYIVCAMSLSILIFALIVVDGVAIFGSICALVIGIYALRKSQKARKQLREDIKRLDKAEEATRK